MPSQKKRFTLDLEPEMQRRLKIAAALKGISMRQYCLEVLGKELEKDQSVFDTLPSFTEESFNQLIALRDEISQGRKSPSNSVDLIREAREQRTQELERLSGS